ncbi:transglycosylase domain-containing protein [Cellulophaga baltica]|uniref:transglycosylase domain-containing protein n=1 Tax=Cellulophaga TaxID=104264 RepID=UPI001C07EA04|nr:MULTISPECIES: transglycosylase domain-containing protein [Cellulophaga]MBU2998069.1 transglycosylase domain-containing protein [Cellulophaga baltica]MDO6769471.1 transglycosylase domain-containing protein [Cellulophaga sp. 1_MG-2023]
MILKKIKSPILRYGLIAALTFVGIVFLFLFSIYIGIWGKLPSKTELSKLEYQKASEVYTADSVLIGKYYLFDRQPIAFEEFPENLKNALISIEDERFYSHSGVDYPSLFRVAIKSILMQDQSSGGGSTITQQLAKNLYPRKDRNKTNIAVDKIKEMFIASRIEDLYNKDEVLYHYLNTVSFGDNTFGIESASLKFFNKKARNLTTEESAVLVGMLKATYGYNPRIHTENSLRRRNLVINAMFKNEFISEAEKDSISNLPLELDYRDFNYNDGLAPYFREEVRKQLTKWSSDQKEKGNEYNIYTSGLKIYTTLDYKMQKMAEEAMVEHLSKLQNSFEKSYGKNAPWLKDKNLVIKVLKRTASYRKLKESGLSEDKIIDSLSKKKAMTFIDWNEEKQVEASVIDSIQHYMKFLNTGSLGIDPNSGAVKTWIGGVNFKYYKYDHISQSKRQVGSTFKPVVYTAALENGITPCTYFSAEEVEYKNLKGWSPSNSGDKEEAYLNYSMEQALSNSVNTVAVKVLEKTGVLNVIRQANKMGITAELPEEPSLALGTGEIKLSEMAGAYASFVNNGKHVTPFLINRIENSKDSILEVFKPEIAEKEAFSDETRQIMIEMMKATINSGTASRIRNSYNIKNDIAGKTGTTQNNKDAWFVGITPKLVHITWVGLDNHELGFKSTSLGQGANAALPMFALFLQKLNKDKNYNAITNAKFEKPTDEVLSLLDCEPIKKDGFLKRLFKNPNKKKSRKFDSN